MNKLWLYGSSPSPTPSNGLTINKKIFQIYSLLAPCEKLGKGLYSSSIHPNFLKQEETETWEVSKLLKVSELVNAFNLKSVAKTLEGVDWVRGKGHF